MDTMKTTNVFDFIQLILNNINTLFIRLQRYKLLQKTLPNISTTFTKSLIWNTPHKTSLVMMKQTSPMTPHKRSVLFTLYVCHDLYRIEQKMEHSKQAFSVMFW